MVSFHFTIKAQNSYSIQQEAIQHAILDLQFKKADNLLGNLVSEHGNLHYLKAYRAYIFSLASNKSGSIDSAEKIIYNQIQALVKDKSESPFKNYYLADLHLMLSTISFQKKEVLKTVSNFLLFHRFQKQNAKEYPEFLLHSKHKFIGQVFEQWLLGFVFNKTADSYLFWKEEFPEIFSNTINRFPDTSVVYREITMASFLFNVYFGVNQPNDSNFNSLSLRGPLETFSMILRLKKDEKYELQYQLLKKADSLKYNQSLPVLDLWHGIALLNKLDSKAETYLTRFLISNENERFSNYVKLKLAWYYLIHGALDKHLKMIAAIHNSKTNFSTEDNQAKYEALHASDWTIELIRSRLLFDGGSYQKSIKELLLNRQKVSNYNQHQKLEYSYRLARAYQKINEFDNAIQFYEMVINSNLDSQYYYISYSAFYLGEVYQALNNPVKASHYFKRCLKFDSPVFKSDIHAKANRALELL